jgi:plastocyanin
MRRASPEDPLRRRLLVAPAGAAPVAAPVLALFLGAALFAAPAPSMAKSRTYTVEIKDMTFGPMPAKLKVGDVVEWVNADIFRHTVTAKNGAFDVDLAPKAHAWTTFHQPLQTGVYCRFHPGMTGAVTVTK